MNKSGDLDTRQYTVNGGWDLIATKTRRNVVYYPCCPEPFPDVTFTIYLRRRTLYYIVNVVVPCLLLAGLSMLGMFTLLDSLDETKFWSSWVIVREIGACRLLAAGWDE